MEANFRSLIASGSIVASVLCNADGTDVELMPAWPYRVTGAELHDRALPLVHRGLAWIGVASLVDDTPQFAFETTPPDAAIEEIRRVFLQHCHALNGDSIEWLCALWSLEDPR